MDTYIKNIHLTFYVRCNYLEKVIRINSLLLQVGKGSVRYPTLTDDGLFM